MARILVPRVPGATMPQLEELLVELLHSMPMQDQYEFSVLCLSRGYIKVLLSASISLLDNVI